MDSCRVVGCYQIGMSEAYISGCLICSGAFEDIKHLIFTYPRAREIWTQLEVWPMIEQAIESDRSGSIMLRSDVIKKGGVAVNVNKVGIAELVTTGAWYIW